MESSLEFVDVAGRKLPVFVKTWAIVDLVLSALRLVIALIYGVVFLCMVLGGELGEFPGDGHGRPGSVPARSGWNHRHCGGNRDSAA